MAHLTRCWCGRQYRCEGLCRPPPGVCTFIELPCGPCPDTGLPGHTRKVEIAFTRIEIPPIKAT